MYREEDVECAGPGRRFVASHAVILVPPGPRPVLRRGQFWGRAPTGPGVGKAGRANPARRGDGVARGPASIVVNGKSGGARRGVGDAALSLVAAGPAAGPRARIALAALRAPGEIGRAHV